VSYPSIDRTIGNTPLVRLQRIGAAEDARRGNVILGKLEGNNPGGSVKDRPAFSMIQRAEERGEIRPGDRLIEATSGNTGIALAMIAAMKGYRMTLIMPDDLSAERRASMKAYGAELILTPARGDGKAVGMEYARDLAMQMQAAGEGIRKWPEAYLPKIYDAAVVDRLEYVTQAESEDAARRLAAEEGIFCGISAAGACVIAQRIAAEVENATIVFIVCDRGDRYLSTGVFPA